MHTWLVGGETQALKNALFSPNISSTVYFLLTREKNLLYIIRQPQEAMKTTLEGVRHFMIEDQFAADFWRWWECIEQCALIGNKQAENSEKIHFYVPATVLVLFHLSHLILIAPRTYKQKSFSTFLPIPNIKEDRLQRILLWRHKWIWNILMLRRQNKIINRDCYAGLSTAFFSVLNTSFFSVLLKNATFYYVLFSSFWLLMRPKRTRECFVLLQYIYI